MERTKSVDRLNTQLFHSLRDISKSPLHFEDAGDSDSTIGDHITEPERSDGETSSSTRDHVEHDAPVEPPAQITRSRVEPPSQQRSLGVAILPKCSLPREELVSFVQQHLSDADSRGVLQAVLFPRQDEEEDDLGNKVEIVNTS